MKMMHLIDLEQGFKKRYTKNEIKEMMTRANLINIKFSDQEPFWVAVGYKK